MYRCLDEGQPRWIRIFDAKTPGDGHDGQPDAGIREPRLPSPLADSGAATVPLEP
jgi:hypothetical protein